MLRVRVGVRVFMLFAFCLFVSLIGPARPAAQTAPQKAAQPPATIAECEEYSRKAGDLQSILAADNAAFESAYDKRAAVQTTLKGYVAKLQTNPEQSDQVIRAILLVLQQLKQAGAEVTSVVNKWKNDDSQYETELATFTTCVQRVPPPSASPGKAQTPASGSSTPPAGVTIILTVQDKSETVNLSRKSDGAYEIVSTLRQGIKLPSNDPAATDTTGPVSVTKEVKASARISPELPGWAMWLGIGADATTKQGAQNFCGPSVGACNASSGPYPGVRRGLGKGWAASESVEVWLCPPGNFCVGKSDPVATISIHWVLP